MSFLSRTSCAIRSISAALLTMYGSSVTMIAMRPPRISSISAFARTVMLPRPSLYAARMPSRPRIRPPVGKSGPFTILSSSSVSMSGSSISAVSASTSSPRLCGGMLVAIPTAMPVAPFIRRLGTRLGRTTGSCSDWSKLGTNATVSLSMSASSSSAIRDKRASVYRIAPGGSPSTLPKLPCPSISG